MKDVFYVLGILFTFGLGLWNAINNYRLSKRTAFINTVTSERVKWIGKLRQNISTFCGLTHTWSLSELEGKPEEPELLKEVDKLRYLIRLQLNPSGDHDQRIEQLIGEIPNLTHSSKRDELRKAMDELIVTTQKLLKEEWEKVKVEAEHGNLKA